MRTIQVPDQQQAEVAAWCQPRPAVVRIESRTQPFDTPVEVVLVEDLIEARVERMCGCAR
jgi:hypothetical protein